ncbi:hypothetical protein RHMOL_Rhmol12G0121200 [Rhododendron molle]|uniref:Uncharacterized protein n=1 Tax=Rhododendron molle TaxID=49168 RepID=A0ACC0LIS6_RHOML|nr:hypothetical protein RHMOL_Rhmol12G0121200 [Rhododendron molle]
MEVEVEVISSDTIKPSTPTPPHLRHYRLSFLDQVIPPVYMPLLLFYPQTAATSSFTQQHKSNNLKTSLSQTLTKFYPLAGRVVNNVHVDCSDAGVPYTEARSHCRLSDLISDPSPSEFIKFLPREFGDVGDVPLAVRVNFFDCGGVVVSMAISHKVADGFSSIFFMNCWAAAGRGGDGDVASPWLDGAELFPPREMAGFNPRTGMVKDPIVTKRFVFTASKISSLIDKCTDDSSPDLKRPTRIEALSAFVWTRFMASAHSENDPNKIYTLLHAVNLRTRANPPLPDHYFGNISRIAITVPSMIDGRPKCYEIVNQVRGVIRKIDEEYVRMLGKGDNHLNTLKERASKFTKGEMVSLNFTSLCRFPLYDADFGWGKPVWVSTAPMPFKNLVVFMDTHSGDGIEAWVNLKAEDMAKFEADEELLAFVSPTKGAN